jgi:NAD(P)-dependent dehydrogenase (short-subunit alcohol dehydrogenase family)
MASPIVTNGGVVKRVGGQLADRVAVVTGAGRGLGRAVAERFVREGATVIAVARTECELRDLAARLGSAPGVLDVVQLDVADDAQVNAFARRVLDRYGRIDALINNAAILEIGPFHAMSMEDFDRTININLRGAVLCTHAFIGAMRTAGRGSIINVGSAASAKGFAGETHYCAAKFGLEGFSEALAIEAREYNVAVNRLSPGYRIKPTSVTLAEAERADPKTRSQWQDPAAMTDAFVFLALQDGAGVTGQHFNAFELAERIRASRRLECEGGLGRQMDLS